MMHLSFWSSRPKARQRAEEPGPSCPKCAVWVPDQGARPVRDDQLLLDRADLIHPLPDRAYSCPYAPMSGAPVLEMS